MSTHPDPVQASFIDARPYNPNKPLTIEERFRRFHRDHPEVYRKLVQLARKAEAQNKRVGMKCLWEVLRWNFWVEKDGAEEFKLNNSYTSRYAREVMRCEFDLRDYFETRKLQS